jgi:lipoprotein-releasing system permease protein
VHFLFAWRYFRGKYNFQAIQMIAWVSVVAIAVGTAALIIVLSVFNGFESLVKGLYSDFYADIKISSAQNKTIKSKVLTFIDKDEKKELYRCELKGALITQFGNVSTLILILNLSFNYRM